MLTALALRRCVTAAVVPLAVSRTDGRAPSGAPLSLIRQRDVIEEQAHAMLAALMLLRHERLPKR
jgi:hypothetical protein